ncbi:molybdenum cofactor guanylyltransferase [Paenibacillus sp. y28]|uniref:molybdenum cofactor guanylyltransferase n=1 Tax=Paenibacillus sp. y28 TaxID=3129110 RepID=UPI0030159490
MLKADLAGIILAGGESRRMNRVAKAHLQMNGSEFIDRICAEMRQICGDVVAVIATEQQRAAFQGKALTVVKEEIPGRGPLGGLEVGFGSCGSPLVWLSACDMPFASARAAAYMSEKLRGRSRCLAAVPFVAGRLHPLQAVYRRECLPHIIGCLEAGERRMMALLGTLHLIQITEAELSEAGISSSRLVMNVNCPQDYEQACLMDKA